MNEHSDAGADEPAREPISVTAVSKAYGPTAALTDVSLVVEPGTVHGLLGPNGSGKTTLLRLLLGLTQPEEGSVTVPHDAVGCAFQEPQVYDGLTVEENLGVFGKLGGADETWVETLVDRCGLGPVRHRPARDLSSGFAKRLDVAIALVEQPSVVILDEPLADVDDTYQSALCDFLAAYASPGRTILVATHRIEAFESLFDAVSVMHGGRIVDQFSVADGVTAGGESVRTQYRAALEDSTDGDDDP